jgi:hypothetical protein
MPRVRLTKKFATFIAGVDLRHAKAGDALDVSPQQARELIADGWAEPDDSKQQRAAAKAKPTSAKPTNAKRPRSTRKRPV